MPEAELIYNHIAKERALPPLDELLQVFLIGIKDGSIQNTLGAWRRFIQKHGNDETKEAS